MACDKCNSKRLMSVMAKCSDLFHGDVEGREIDGYVPENLNIGGGDYIDFDSCLDCGKIQGSYPLEKEIEYEAR